MNIMNKLTQAHQEDSPLSLSADVARRIGRASDGGSEGIAKLAEQADKEGWPAARYLAALAEHEIADRGRRRIERHLAEARLPVGKTLDAFDFTAVPMISKAQVMALASGDGWIEQGANLLLFGPSEPAS